VIQIDERINDIAGHFDPENKLNDFERSEVVDRLNKLIQMNRNIQMELVRQVQNLEHIKQNVGKINADFDPQSRPAVQYKG
jgi:hypothetical protein